MTTPDTKNGITKDSTLIINVPQYLSNNYKQTLNYVGYWKWDSTNQTFIQVLNNQDIIDEKYNLRIQPLFYDADTGLPQKVTVNSGNTKKLKMVNDNNDGALEPAEYIENNTMVRFNSKTRSVTEYPYFEVEALPPTITSPITSNGYYKFDGNTLISGTEQNYNINVNVTEIPALEISRYFKLYNDINGQISTNYYELNYVQVQNTVTYNLNNGYSYLIIVSHTDFSKSGKAFYFLSNFTPQTPNSVSFVENHWVCIIAPNTITQSSPYIRVLLYKNNNTNQPNEIVLTLRDIDEGNYDYWAYVFITDSIRTINIV